MEEVNEAEEEAAEEEEEEDVEIVSNQSVIEEDEPISNKRKRYIKLYLSPKERRKRISDR